MVCYGAELPPALLGPPRLHSSFHLPLAGHALAPHPPIHRGLVPSHPEQDASLGLPAGREKVICTRAQSHGQGPALSNLQDAFVLWEKSRTGVVNYLDPFLSTIYLSLISLFLILRGRLCGGSQHPEAEAGGSL